MNERAELMNDKLQEKDTQLSSLKSECAKKDEVVRGLEQSLGDLAKSLDAQNRRIMQLTSRNEELFRLYHAKSKEVEDLHSKMIEDTDSKRLSCQEIDQVQAILYYVNSTPAHYMPTLYSKESYCGTAHDGMKLHRSLTPASRRGEFCFLSQ